VSAAAPVTAAPEGEMKALRELTKDDYNTFLEEAGDTLVVVDFYTDWYSSLDCRCRHVRAATVMRKNMWGGGIDCGTSIL
jgi:hypothetical protein